MTKPRYQHLSLVQNNFPSSGSLSKVWIWTMSYRGVLFNSGKLFPNNARSRWLLLDHMTSKNGTVSCQNLRRQRSVKVHFYQQILTVRWIYFSLICARKSFLRELVSYIRLVSRETVAFVSLKTSQ